MNGRLLVLSPNWLGDAVMALPALAAVQAAWHGPVDVAARPAVGPLFTLVRGVDQIVTLDRGTRSAESLRRAGYAAALLLTNSFQTAWLVRAAGIPERWGYRADGRSWLLTRAVARPLRLHQVDYYRGLTTALGYPGGPEHPQIEAPADRRHEGHALLSAAGWDRVTPLVALAPGAAFGSAKRWPSASYGALASRLAQSRLMPVLIGGPGDRRAGDEVRAAWPGAVVDLIGRTDLPQLAGVLSHCRTLVTNDSGAMHFAAALGLDVVVMFGPTRETETYPRGAGRHAFLKHDVWCRPCMLRECPLTHRCMTGISVEAAHAAVVHR